MRTATLLLSLLLGSAAAVVPRDALPLAAAEWPRDYRLHLEFAVPSRASLRMAADTVVALPKGVAYESRGGASGDRRTGAAAVVGWQVGARARRSSKGGPCCRGR